MILWCFHIQRPSVSLTEVAEPVDKANTGFSNMWPVEIEDKSDIKVRWTHLTSYLIELR